MSGNASRAASPNPIFAPTFKSHGIKTKLVPWIRQNLPETVSGTYFKPFMAPGVIGLNLRFSETNPMEDVPLYCPKSSSQRRPSRNANDEARLTSACGLGAGRSSG